MSSHQQPSAFAQSLLQICSITNARADAREYARAASVIGRLDFKGEIPPPRRDDDQSKPRDIANEEAVIRYLSVKGTFPSSYQRSRLECHPQLPVNVSVVPEYLGRQRWFVWDGSYAATTRYNNLHFIYQHRVHTIVHLSKKLHTVEQSDSTKANELLSYELTPPTPGLGLVFRISRSRYKPIKGCGVYASCEVQVMHASGTALGCFFFNELTLGVPIESSAVFIPGLEVSNADSLADKMFTNAKIIDHFIRRFPDCPPHLQPTNPSTPALLGSLDYKDLEIEFIAFTSLARYYRLLAPSIHNEPCAPPIMGPIRGSLLNQHMVMFATNYDALADHRVLDRWAMQKLALGFALCTWLSVEAGVDVESTARTLQLKRSEMRNLWSQTMATGTQSTMTVITQPTTRPQATTDSPQRVNEASHTTQTTQKGTPLSGTTHMSTLGGPGGDQTLQTTVHPGTTSLPQRIVGSVKSNEGDTANSENPAVLSTVEDHTSELTNMDPSIMALPQWLVDALISNEEATSTVATGSHTLRSSIEESDEQFEERLGLPPSIRLLPSDEEPARDM